MTILVDYVCFFFPVVERCQYKPVCVYGQKKYGPNGMYDDDSFRKLGFGRNITNMLINIANHSLANRTWSTYNTVKNQLEKCENAMGKKFKFPMNQKDILTFISWLLTERRVKSSTINTYISALRTIHLAKGVIVKELRPGLLLKCINLFVNV